MTEVERREQIARIIADELGDDLDAAFENKAAWVDARGGKPFRDCNMPYRSDYLSAADRVLALAQPVSSDEVAKAAQALLDFIGDRDMRVYASDPPVKALRAALSQVSSPAAAGEGK